MFAKKTPIKFGHGLSTSVPKSKDVLPEVALAAIASYKKQKEVSDFMSFFLGALERNSDWLNGVVGKQTNFRCALMVGAGPNRFQLQEIIYPTSENDIQLEVEHRDSEDYDKIAIAALLKLTNFEIDQLLKYIKNRLHDNRILKEDLLKGKSLGISFAVLRPFSEKQYRVVERITIGSSMKCVIPVKKRRLDEKSIARSPLKKTKRFA
ncbi:uncharacterized protein LOC123660959 [Melitaea cinxia]|uniref:uncharacterized protein LOC123660959 n=1 Tax=Melitaea cinxia TaxID=113334 RepID=UPI001E272B3C|nr:uncharacterized protein LOC123660959 [Melitaea cinxia]